ncbi:MAG: O-antigen ligase family protein [Gemmatimonadaceae bacterium]
MLLVLWIMLIGADRIDLLGGGASFILTPYLALTPIVVASEVIRRWREGRSFRVPRLGLAYALLASALVAVVLLSAVGALDVQISAARALLLTAQIGGTLAVVLLCRGRSNLAPTLARGALACLLLFALFDFAEAWWWIGRGAETMRFGPMLLHFGALQNVGPVPRLAGPVSDANRGGFVLLFYALLIVGGERRPVVRRVALAVCALFVLLTISRSAWLGGAAMLVVLAFRWRGRVPLALGLATSLVIAAGVTLFMVDPAPLTRVASMISTPVSRRLTTSEGSAQSHVALIERGLNDATESVPQALVGLGYGNSHLVLQDVFPGNKYGNFHSLYVSMFAESGIAALLLVLVMILTPAVAGGPWRPLIAGAIVFNVFYQTPTEPAFWFALAAAWVTMPSRRGGRTP